MCRPLRRSTLTVITLVLMLVAVARAQRPAATITSINPQTGAVVGRVTGTGQGFQFRATAVQLKLLHIGQPLYVNLRSNQVSLDGRSVFASITMLAPAIAARTGGGASGGSPAACCTVIGVVQGQNLAHAKVTSSGQAFDFALNNPAQMPQVYSGQPIYANFTTNQVSLDGQQTAGYIVQPSSGYNLGGNPAAASAPPAPPVPPPNTVPTSPTGGSTTQPNPLSPATTAISNSVGLPAPAPAADFSIAFAPGAPASLAPGTPVSLPITVTRIGNFNGTINLSSNIVGYASNAAQITPTAVTLGCSASPRPGSFTPSRLSCVNTASATLNTAMEQVIPPPPGSGQSPAYPSLLITITGTNTAPGSNNTIAHSAQLQIASTPPASSSGTTPPVTPGAVPAQAAAGLLAASGTVVLPSQCATDPRLNCDANNNPVQTGLQVTENNLNLGLASGAPGTYSFIANLGLLASNIPVFYSGMSCVVTIDTSGSPATETGLLSVVSLGNNLYGVTISGLQISTPASGVQVAAGPGGTGGNLCTSASPVQWSALMYSLVQQALTSRVPNPVCINVSASGATTPAACGP